MIEIEKYDRLKRWVIILSVVVFVLVVILGWTYYSLYKGFFAQYAPKDGIWYCDELSLTLSYETDQRSYFLKNGEKIICSRTGHTQSRYVDIYEVEEIVREDGDTAYMHKALLFEFEILQLEQEYFVVCDNSNNKYKFVRQ